MNHGQHDHKKHGHQMHTCGGSGADATTAKVTDPVCGMKVDPRSAAGTHAHAGVTYHFCGKRCLIAFKADPEKYLAKSVPAETQATPAGTQYTCPMHPEIVQVGPGSCPKCGMALMPIAGTGEADDSELRDLTRRMWVGVALSIPLVVLAMGPMVGIHEPFGLMPRLRGWIEFTLGTPVVLWVGWPILHKFWLSLAHRALNMYTLIGLGVGLAYLFSLAAVFVPGWFPLEFREHDGAVGTYFEAAAVIVTLVKGDLRGIVRAAVLSRATMRNIRQNLAFAFGYNALGIPIAAGVLYPAFGLLLSPIFAGAAMALSSVSVVTNALRLNRVRL
jgi:YHS domain-containing protein